MKEFTRGDSKWKRWRIFRVSIDRYPERRSILERNDDVSSWEERVVSLSLSLSLHKRASCNLRNRFPSSYYIVSPERRVIHRGGNVGQEMWSVCGGLYRPTPNLLLICCVDNGANGMILSKPVYIYIKNYTDNFDYWKVTLTYYI